jgi:hypothetical protein
MPGEELMSGNQRWRWLSTHIAMHSYQRRVYKTPFEQTAPTKSKKPN